MNAVNPAEGKALEVIGLSKRFDASAVVDDIDFAVSEGEFVSLLGPSGCGKSTTLMMIAGFLPPTRGEIRIAGQLVNGLPPEKRHTGMVFQNYALFPHMTVEENVGFGLRMRKVPPAARSQKVDQMLELVNMGALRDRLPRQLSGGQQQRVALARALVIEPALLLLDEPFSALDRKLREQMQTEVRALQRRLGITTLFVTHDQEEALVMSDRVAVMNAGRIEGLAAPRTLYREPPTAFVARFLGAGNFISGKVDARDSAQITVDTALGKVALSAHRNVSGSSVELFVRPEQIRMVDYSVSETGETIICGTLVETYFHGARTLAIVEVAGLATGLIVACGADHEVAAVPARTPLKLAVRHDSWCLYSASAEPGLAPMNPGVADVGKE